MNRAVSVTSSPESEQACERERGGVRGSAARRQGHLSLRFLRSER